MTCIHRDTETGKNKIHVAKWKTWIHSVYGFTEEIPEGIDIVEEGDSVAIYLYGKVVLGGGPRTAVTFSPPDAHGINPLVNARYVDDVKDFSWDIFKVSDRYVEYLKKKAEYLYKNTEYALVYSLAGRLHAWAQELRGGPGGRQI